MARDDGPHSRDGPDLLWHRRPGIVPAADTVDNRSGRLDTRLRFSKGILLTHFTQPETGPRRAAQLPVLLQDEILGTD